MRVGTAGDSGGGADRETFALARLPAGAAFGEQPRDASSGRLRTKPVADNGKQRSFGNASSYLAARIARDAPKIRAERRLGELLREMPKAKGGRPKKTGDNASPVSTDSLSDQGISKKQSERKKIGRTLAPSLQRIRPHASNKRGHKHRGQDVPARHLHLGGASRTPAAWAGRGLLRDLSSAVLARRQRHRDPLRLIGHRIPWRGAGQRKSTTPLEPRVTWSYTRWSRW